MKSVQVKLSFYLVILVSATIKGWWINYSIFCITLMYIITWPTDCTGVGKLVGKAFYLI